MKWVTVVVFVKTAKRVYGLIAIATIALITTTITITTITLITN